MPEISRFFGIVVTMFYNEHNPPHFHVRYNEYEAQFDLLEGAFFSRVSTLEAISVGTCMVRDSFDELLTMWDTREFHMVKPLE